MANAPDRSDVACIAAAAMTSAAPTWSNVMNRSLRSSVPNRSV
jgi:hypothetical protein